MTARKGKLFSPHRGRKKTEAPKKSKRGRKPWQPAPEQMTEIMALATVGTPQSVIANFVGVSPETLRRHFRVELDKACVRMVTAVSRNLVHIATVGKGSAAVSAAKHILSHRADWWRNEPIDVNIGTGGGLTGLLKRIQGPDAAVPGDAPDSPGEDDE